jgi:hypothetical protein
MKIKGNRVGQNLYLAKGIKTILGRTRQGDGVTITIGKLCYDCCINPCGFCNGL